jgi:cold shock CspA family protein
MTSFEGLAHFGRPAVAGRFLESIGIKHAAPRHKPQGSKMQGKIKYASPKGFAFIEVDGGGADIFLHYKNLPEGMEDIAVNTRVSFRTQPSRKPGKGDEAIGVELL